MVSVIVKDNKIQYDFDYTVSSIESLDSLMKVIYKPIIGLYSVGIELTEIRDVRYLLNNKSRYDHVNITILLSESVFKKVSLAMPNTVGKESMSMYEYLIDGISKRHLLIKKKVIHLLYTSIGKSYSDIDDALDLLESKFGRYLQITEKDVSKHIAVSDIVYPRSVLIAYINLYKYRKGLLSKCLADISPDIVLASMIKNVKKLHEQKCKYLKTGIGSKFIKTLNTKNLNIMYYMLVVQSRRNVKDITILLELYERGITINDLLF